METGREGELFDAGEAVWAGWSGADLGVDCPVKVLLSWSGVTGANVVTEKKQALSFNCFVHSLACLNICVFSVPAIIPAYNV